MNGGKALIKYLVFSVSALNDGRNYIGYDIKQEYVDLSNKRINEVRDELKQKILI